MSSAEFDPLAALGELAALPASADRDDKTAAAVRAALLAAPHELTRQRLRAACKRDRLVPMTMFDAIAREALELAAPAASAAPGAQLPEGARGVPGAPHIAYLPAEDGPGRIWEIKGRDGWRELVPWSPYVPAHLAATGEHGAAGMQFYEIHAGGRSGVWSHDELVAGKPWEVLPVAGTASRRMREVLALVVQAEAAERDLTAALTRTGWHYGEDGKPFYVFADGRASDGREVCLASSWGEALGGAARPVPPASLAEIVAALAAIGEHGGPAALVALGLGARGLGHSFHAVPGGLVLVGLKFSGKTSAAWHARNLLFVNYDRQGNYPPQASTVFAGRPAAIEGVLDFEADSPALVEDLALPEDSSRKDQAEAEAKLELIFRSLFNATEVKPRSNIHLGHRPGRRVRSAVIATAETLTVKSSLLTRVLRYRVKHGVADFEWYKGPDGTKRNSASLVAPLRTLGEHFIIPDLARRGDQAGEYLAQCDNEGLALLAPALEARLPGWETSPTGIARVAEIAAAVLGGLVLIADAVSLPRHELAAAVVPALVGELAAQAAELEGQGEADSAAEVLGAALRAAPLDGRAHTRDDQGNLRPIPGLTEQECGLERTPGREGGDWRGRGAPFYWLPELGALGVPSPSLHKLLKAANDSRVRVPAATLIAKWAVTEGLALPSGQQGSPYVRQEWIGGDNKRVVLVRPEIFFGETCGQDDSAPARPARPARPQAGGAESNGSQETAAPLPARPQVTGHAQALAGTGVPYSDLPSDQAPSGSIGSAASYPLETAAGRKNCAVCGLPLDPVLVALGETTHAGRACNPVLPPEAEAAAAATSTATRAPSSPPSLEAIGRAPGWAFACLDVDGRAHGPGGEVIAALPPGAFEAIAARGRGGLAELAELGLDLTSRKAGSGVLYIPAETAAALGLPAELGDVGPTEGAPHPFAEADPALWDVRPAGLAPWLNVYRRPETLHEGLDVAFPGWARPVRGDGPQLGELGAAELAAALTLIWEATRQPGGSAAGSAHYHRSPPATMRRLLKSAARRSKLGGVPAAREMPRPFTEAGRKGGTGVRVPGAHTGPAAQIPAGWILAEADVRSCYLSAAKSTWFALGDYHEARPGRLSEAPGVHLVRAPAGASVIHPALMPWFRPPGPRQREVWAVLDTLAARWLAERGVPLEVSISYVAEDRGRVFDSVLGRLGAARDRLKGDAGRPAAAARMVVTAMYQHTLGGWLASDAWDRAGDWLHAPDWWLTIKTQAEVRKQRALLPSVSSGALVVLRSEAIDTVLLAAPSLEALEAAQTSGGRRLVREAAGGFRIERTAEVTPGLAADLSSAAVKTRRAALEAAFPQSDTGKE